MIRGFAPIARPDARVLVLGTIPSERSLAEHQYYAHPRNSFWKIMLTLFAKGTDLDYPERAELLTRNRVALWDVLHAGDRPGSLDSSIVSGTAVPNDIAGFLELHPDVRAVFFNGTAAEKLYHAHNTLPPDRAMTFTRLPSTSPAHAARSFADKLAAWQVVATAAGGSDRVSQRSEIDGRKP